jgi:hypothetical protein
LHSRWLIIIWCLSLGWVVVAQDTLECAIFVQRAVEIAQDACDDIQANTACYGHDNVSASPYPQGDNFQFQATGDRADISQIASLKTQVPDMDDGLWGIARMDVDTLIPNSSEHNTITMLMFGDVEIINNFEPDELLGVVNASSNVNIRRSPSTSDVALGIVAHGEAVVIVGRNADSTWLRIRTEDFEGWLLQDFITFENDGQRLDIIESLANVNQVRGAYYSSMQSFLMRSNPVNSDCEDFPQSGLILQTHDKERVTILVNDALIEFDSTIHLQTTIQAETTVLAISTLEGETLVESQNRTQLAQRGQTITVELDDNGAAVQTPSIAVPLDLTAINALPIPLLPRNICVPAPYQSSIDRSKILDTNLSGVNLDELESFGTPGPEELGNLGWVRLNYNVSNDVGSLNIDDAYNRYQPLLQQYTDNGYQTILILTHQTYGEGRDEFLPWSEMTDAKWRQLSDELAIMACQIAKQYDQQGIVKVYQIWNEQDAPIGARASVSMSNENYAYMVTQVSQAIRTADPEALIITGGYVSGPGDGVQNALKMVRLLPSTTLLDGIAFHPYGRGVDFNSPYRVYGHIDASIQAYSAILPGKPLWVTEFGVLNRVVDPSPEIAEYAMSMLNYVDKWYGDRVAAMVWYAWAEGMDNGYGLVDNDENPRPILYEQFTTFLAATQLQEAPSTD